MGKDEENSYQTTSWNKITHLFSDTDLFFEELKSEKGIISALITFILAGILGIGLKYVVMASMPTGSLFPFLTPNTTGTISLLILSILLVVSLIVIPVYSAIVHLILWVMNSKGNYSETYKVMLYSFAPYQILSAVPFIGNLTVVYSYFLMIKGISKMYNVSRGKAILACVLPGAFFLGGFLLLVGIVFLRNI